MVAQLRQPQNYTVCSEMHEVWAIKMLCDTNATPGIINGPYHEDLMSSRGLSFMRWLVVMDDQGWAMLCTLTNIQHKSNEAHGRTEGYISLLPTFISVLFSSWSIHTTSILISTSRDLHNTTPVVPKHTREPTQLCTFPLGFLQLHIAVS